MFRACFGGAFQGQNESPAGSVQPALRNASAAQEARGSGRLINAAAQTSSREGNSPALSGVTNHPSRSSIRGEVIAAGHSSANRTLSAMPTLNAARIREMRPEDVSPCDASKIMEGTYRGIPCAVKIMLCSGLERAAVRELLLSPSLVHPNIVMTYASRCAHLTHAFFDLLEGERNVGRDPNRPRVLEPAPLRSDDGFGDPKDLYDGTDPLVVLHRVLHSLGAEIDNMMVVVVQEHCNRGTLYGAIRKQIFQPTQYWVMRVARRAVLRTAAEMARGLLHLHDLGVVHGDLKPANILLNTSKEDRRGFTSKVGDFGLAHVLPANATSLDADCWGSIAYMAPEGLDGRVSRATDVWAFGVCLWEMLTGQRPYGGMHCAEVLAGVRDGRLQLAWPDGAPLSDGIIALGRSCLHRDPRMRPRLDAVIQSLVDIERVIRAELIARMDPPAVPQQQHQPAPAAAAVVAAAAAAAVAVPAARRLLPVSAPGVGAAAAAASTAAGGLAAYPAAPLSNVAGEGAAWDMVFL